MQIITTCLGYEKYLKQELANNTIGFVPTMGFLHDGHFALIKQSISENNITVVSIFVNPTQFGKNEDFSNYPSDIAKDTQMLEDVGVDVLFIPEVNELYPNKAKSLMSININKSFLNILCGKYRPGHFEGVATIVLKLLNIIKATTAYFGLKDYQQFILIKNITTNMRIPTNIVGVGTLREESGLAMSSRNSYLSETERELAANIYKKLSLIQHQITKNSIININELEKSFISMLEKESNKFEVQYLEIYDTELNPIKNYQNNNTFIAAAVFLGNVRLIDNLVF